MSLMWAADLAAITIPTSGVFFPRHQRRDLVTACLDELRVARVSLMPS